MTRAMSRLERKERRGNAQARGASCVPPTICRPAGNIETIRQPPAPGRLIGLYLVVIKAPAVGPLADRENEQHCPARSARKSNRASILSSPLSGASLLARSISWRGQNIVYDDESSSHLHCSRFCTVISSVFFLRDDR